MNISEVSKSLSELINQVEPKFHGRIILGVFIIAFTSVAAPLFYSVTKTETPSIKILVTCDKLELYTPQDKIKESIEASNKLAKIHLDNCYRNSLEGMTIRKPPNQ